VYNIKEIRRFDVLLHHYQEVYRKYCEQINFKDFMDINDDLNWEDLFLGAHSQKQLVELSVWFD
jgi:hypothetical protein